MGDRIINLPTTSTPLTASDKIPYAPASQQGSTFATTVGDIAAFMQANFINPEFTVTAVAANSGDILSVSPGANAWLAITCGSLTTLSIRLPSSSDAFDGQEVIITIDGSVRTLSIGANGCDTNGAPASCDDAKLGVRFRFQSAILTWSCITNHGNSFDSVRLDSGIRDGSDNEVIDVVGVASAVNHVQVTNAATGGTVAVEAVGDDSDVAARFRSKGAGTANFSSPSGTTSIGASSNPTVMLGDTSFVTAPRLPAATTVAALPAAADNTNGLRFVSDANATTGGTIVAGGGANRVLVNSDGTNWRIC